MAHTCAQTSAGATDIATPSDTSLTETAAHQSLQEHLRLDLALNLLHQAGWEAPEGVLPWSPAWLQAVVDGLCDVSSRDALTGLANRRQFEIAIAREVDRVARAGEPALLLVLDIDHFKKVNDVYGHDAGDAVIQSVANVLQDCVRPMDTVARIGGEEFAMILPNCAPTFGETVAERVRNKVATQTVAVVGGQNLQVTVSVGGAFAPQWVRSSSQLWLKRADQQLYQAKREGRNRTCLELPAMTSVSIEEKEMLFGAVGQPFGQSDALLADDLASGSGPDVPTTTA
jgi:diguanylate cyclase